MMKKFITFITSMFLVFGLSSCNSNYDSSFISDNTDGGPYSRVVGSYFFYSFDDYQYFYEIFKDYNIERYWQPIDDEDFDMCYRFQSGGVYLDDIRENRYDIDFDLQSMYVHISDEDFSLELSVYDINYVYSVDVFNIEELSYSLSEPNRTSPEKYPVSFSNNDIVIGDGYFISEKLDKSAISGKLDKILPLFKESYDYVF